MADHSDICMKRRTRDIEAGCSSRLVLLILSLCIVCDQATKAIARANLDPAQRLSYLGGLVVFEYAENTGAMLGVGGDLPPAVRIVTLVIFNSILLGGALWVLLKVQNAPWLSVIGSTLLISGGIGNIIDRLANQGAVVDFVHIGIGRLRTGIFNLADLAIVVGAGLVVLWSLQHKGDECYR